MARIVAQLPDHLEPTHPRHFEIDERDVERGALEAGKSFFGALCDLHRRARRGQMHAREFPKNRIVVGHENARLVVEDIGEGAIAPGCGGMRGCSGNGIGLMRARLRGFQLPLRFAQTLNKLGIRRFGQANLLGQGGLARGGRFAEQADADFIAGAPADLGLARA